PGLPIVQPAPTRLRLQSPPDCASAGTRRCSCSPAAIVPATTSLPRCAGTRLPAAATTAPAVNTRTDTALADRADRSQDATFRPVRPARTPASPGPVARRTPRSPDTCGRQGSVRPASPETSSSAPALRPGYTP